MSVDNIITTKNIKISNVTSVHSEMADHDLLYADLEFLDQAEGAQNTGNRALGQEVTVTSSANDTSAYDSAAHGEGSAYIGLVSDSDLTAESWILIKVQKN